ncbi:MAG TPA: CDP-glycerol glycerophosphotransferase family protein, partial [Jatrophihabitans sp.]|nr:CDP-glycerol glycerophosphotransferase family protein [Jatrophihabitans sp.]
MGTFTFQAGNAAGLRRLPLYFLGAIATLVVPRTPRVWVFGSGIGPGEGALPLLRVARAELPAAARLVWLATTEDELARARALGLDAERKLSWRGFWLTLRAQVLVVTHGLGDVNRYAVRGGFVVQLWHGIPLKRLHLDAPVAQSASSRLGRAVVRRGYQVVGRQIDLFPVAGDPVVGRIASAFGTPRDRIAVTGDPRDDVLLQGTPHERRAAAREGLGDALGHLPGAGPLILYAPTWRDGEPDPAAPDEQIWKQLAAWLDAVDGALIVRNHPLGHADYSAGPQHSPRIKLLDAGEVADLTPLLPAFDHL